jgi:hypothetical protein
MGRRSKVQGEGARDSGRRNPGYGMDIDKPCQGDAESLRRPLRARILSVPTPGFRSLRDLHPGLRQGALSELEPAIAATINTSVADHWLKADGGFLLAAGFFATWNTK